MMSGGTAEVVYRDASDGSKRQMIGEIVIGWDAEYGVPSKEAARNAC
jgi:hypothetical protein